MDRLYIAYSMIEDYCSNLLMKGRKQRTVEEYRYRLRMVVKVLRKADLETHPAKIGEIELHYLLFIHMQNKSSKYKHHTIQILSRWMVIVGKNDSVQKMDILWPHSERCVTWLTPEQMLYILDITNGLDHVAIHLAGQMGLRCAEIANLKLKDIQYPWINVLGKGHMEGKLAPVYVHQDTKMILDDWMVTRSAIVSEHMRRHPDIPVPNNLLLHNHRTGGVATAYSPKTLGNRMIALSKKLGIDFSMHTFRRSYATMLSDCGVPIEVIRDAMRHENIETTALYIRRNPSRLIAAREKQNNMENMIRCKKKQSN